MAESQKSAGKIASARDLIRLAQTRADRARLLADDFQVRAARHDSPNGEAYRRMALAHRGSEQRHVAVAELHSRYLASLQSDRLAADLPAAGPPRFVGALAERVGVADLGLVLFADGWWVAATGATPLASAAQDLEYTLAEGPLHEVDRGVVCADTPEAIRRRWQRYGAALTSLGARSVQAAPIRPAGVPVGALLVLDRPTDAPAGALHQLAEEVALSLLLASESMDPDAGLGGHPAMDEATDWAHIHQAAGMVSVEQRCTVRDALDLMRARAYAEDIPIVRLAEHVVRRETCLD